MNIAAVVASPASEATMSARERQQRFGAMDDFVPNVERSFHEAGHLVVGYFFGLRPEFIYADNVDGVVVFAWDNYVWWHQSTLMMLLAGEFAEAIPSGHLYRPTDEDVRLRIKIHSDPFFDRTDFSKVIAALRRRYPADDPFQIPEEYRPIEKATIDLLDRPDIRRAIRAVAIELVRYGRLQGDQAVRIAAQFIEPRIEGVLI